ncbi:ChrR family anti-sigma-E factor [Rhizobium sp. L1K21]|uniref:ChrR family anti-sigma-E factor n=1 Tax=Rhizobium sp. L1K21 TaxID=2954933 RepID=UPI002093638A|nr:ChrR family anti-sigma-E factor [Rhizobium sp. L1K21]MCO6185259.1 ChrR family anti-sigma-E factor [Rhizobium sp. L1K21]
MNISHHIGDELLLEYATGALSEGWSVAVATHLAMCPHCRARLAAMEATGAQLMEGIEPPPTTETDEMSWSLLSERIDTVDQETSGEKPIRYEPRKERTVPEPLYSYLGGNPDEIKWRSLGLGAYHFPVKLGDKSTSVRLLRIPAGKPVPEHGHGGRELTLVLSGSFSDANGRFGPGDFEETDDDIEHQPVADPGEDCICLAVTDAPLKFKSRIVRIIQPLLGI